MGLPDPRFVDERGRTIVPVADATDPLIGAVIDKLPPGGSSWPAKRRAAWFEMLWKACEVVYADDGEEIAMPSFLPHHAVVADERRAALPLAPAAPAPPGNSPGAARAADTDQPLPPFFIDGQGFARRGADGERILPAEAGGMPIVDLRGEEGDLGAIVWADDSRGVRGLRLEITTTA
jgi:hypothetical protein